MAGFVLKTLQNKRAPAIVNTQVSRVNFVAKKEAPNLAVKVHFKELSQLKAKWIALKCSWPSPVAIFVEITVSCCFCKPTKKVLTI